MRGKITVRKMMKMLDTEETRRVAADLSRAEVQKVGCEYG